MSNTTKAALSVAEKVAAFGMGAKLVKQTETQAVVFFPQEDSVYLYEIKEGYRNIPGRPVVKMFAQDASEAELLAVAALLAPGVDVNAQAAEDDVLAAMEARCIELFEFELLNEQSVFSQAMRTERFLALKTIGEITGEDDLDSLASFYESEAKSNLAAGR